MVMLSSYPKRSVLGMEEKSIDTEDMSDEELHKMFYIRVGRRKRSFFNPKVFWKKVTRERRQKKLLTRVGRLTDRKNISIFSSRC